MKKIRDFFVPGNTSKYSDLFYRKILIRSSIVVVLVTSLLLVFFTWQTVDSRFNEAKATLESENTECYTNLNDVLNSAQNISMFFARFKDVSPLYQAESKINVREVMLVQEATTFVSCFDFLDGIQVETPDVSVAFSITSHVEYEELQYMDPFTFYVTTADSYPHLLKLSYVSTNLDTFSVDVVMHSEYLSTHYMSEHSYLLDHNGVIILARDYTLIGKSISEVASVDLSTLKSGDTSSKFLYAGQYFSDTSSEDGMMLVTLTSKSDVYKGTLSQIVSLFLVYFVVMFICIVLLYFILGYLYRPIKDVAQVLKYHMPDNDRMLETDAEFIKNCMKRYATSGDVDSALLQIRKSQLHTLHAQISPHLLGNTLESIKWGLIHVSGEDSELVKAIGSLSLFLTESYEYQRMITSFGAEIERTKYYADMMVFCFFKHLNIEWEVSENILDCAIVNLTLQPFIENCIEHGFTREEENPRILIRIGENEYQYIHIEIEDNGVGMTPDVLDSIRASLRDDGTVHKHVGIKNSHLKLKLLFGDEYGVTDIQSDENGTYVKITIPKRTAPHLLPPPRKYWD